MRKGPIPENWVRWWLYGSTRRTVAPPATPLSVSGEPSQEAPAGISGRSHTIHCKKRAGWRLQTKKPSELLSSHYRLNCEYGTSLMTHWKRSALRLRGSCQDLEFDRESGRPPRESPSGPAARGIKQNERIREPVFSRRRQKSFAWDSLSYMNSNQLFQHTGWWNSSDTVLCPG